MFEVEIFKPLTINNTDTDYVISNCGTVHNTRTNHTLTQSVRKTENGKPGYAQVTLFINKKNVTKLIHRLVGETFIPNPDNFPIINHKNGVKISNHEENLHWTDYSYNNKHAYDTGLKISLKGEQIHFNKYKEDTIIEICEDFSKGYTVADVSEKYNIPINTIRGIHVKEKWKHITNDYNFDTKIKRHSTRKTDLRLSIIELIEDGLSNIDIINNLGLDINNTNRNYIAMIRHRLYNKKEGSTTNEIQYYDIEFEE
jgi:hypothetical protein